MAARPYQCDTAEAIAGRFKAACDAGYTLPVLTSAWWRLASPMRSERQSSGPRASTTGCARMGSAAVSQVLMPPQEAGTTPSTAWSPATHP
jgi:hypothetical protein